MATKELFTRIQLKYDTYENWTTKNPVLKSGEVAIATIAQGATSPNQATPPAVLIKVGDGTSNYSALPFTSALAADVHSWAKAANKPTYAASEITGIGDYIATYVDETLGISVDTDTQYRILKVDDYNYKLQSKAKGEADTAFADVSTIVIPKYDDTDVKADIDALEELVGTTAVATQIANAIAALDLANTYEAKGEAAKVQTALNNYKTENDAKVQANTEAIGVLNGTGEGSVDKKVADAINEFAAKVSDDGTVNTYKELIDYAAEHGSEFTELVGVVDANTEAIDAIEADYLKAADKTALQKAISDQATSDANTYETKTDASAKLTEAKGYTDEAKAALIGKSTDTVTADTLEGVRKYAYSTANSQCNSLASQLNTEIDKKANDADLAAIAKTGNVNDLVQTTGDYLIFNCGSASTVI